MLLMGFQDDELILTCLERKKGNVNNAALMLLEESQKVRIIAI